MVWITNLLITGYSKRWGKVHPKTGHEGSKEQSEVQLYSFPNLSARWGWVVNATPRPLYPRKRPGTHCIGGWVGPRAGQDMVFLAFTISFIYKFMD